MKIDGNMNIIGNMGRLHSHWKCKYYEYGFRDISSDRVEEGMEGREFDVVAIADPTRENKLVLFSYINDYININSVYHKLSMHCSPS